MSGHLRRINSASSGVIDSARCHGCGHLARIHNGVGCVFGLCECNVPRSGIDGGGPRLEVPDGVESTPAAPPSKPAPPPVAAAPAPAVAPAAPSVVAEAGLGATAPVAPAPAPVASLFTEDVRQQVDAIIAAGKAKPYKPPRRIPARPAAPTAQVSQAVVGEPDAVEEVAAGSDATGPVATADLDQFRACTLGCGWTQERTEFDDEVGLRASRGQHERSHSALAPVARDGFIRWEPVPATAQATPEPLDLAPFLGASLHYYSAWYCAACFQRRHDPGACPTCKRPLAPVHVITFPRSIA